MEPPWNGHDFGNRLAICVSCCFMHNFFYVGWWSLSMFQNTHSFVDIDGAFVCLWILLYDWRCQLKSASIRSSSSNRTGIVQPFLTYTVMTHRLTINFPGLNASLMCPSAYLVVGCSSKVAPHLLLFLGALMKCVASSVDLYCTAFTLYETSSFDKYVYPLSLFFFTVHTLLYPLSLVFPLLLLTVTNTCSI